MCLERDNSAGTCVFGPLNVFRSLPEASSTHSATAQQSPQGSSMKGLCAVVGIGTTAVLHSVLKIVGGDGKSFSHPEGGKGHRKFWGGLSFNRTGGDGGGGGK